MSTFRPSHALHHPRPHTIQVTIYTLLASKPFLHGSPLVFARSREAIIFGNVVSSLGSTYMVATSTNAAVNAGIWMLDAGLLTEAFLTAAAHDSPCGLHEVVARAWMALAVVFGRRGRARGAVAARSAPRLALVASAVDTLPDPEGCGSAAGGGGAGKAGGHAVRLLLPINASTPMHGPSPSSSDVVLHRLIGCGSFASVFSGSFGGAPVAVKVLCAASPEAQAAAREEARLSLSLRHPHVLQSFAVLDVDVNGAALLTSNGFLAAGSNSRSRTAALAEFASVVGASRADPRGGGGQLYDPLGGPPSLSPAPSGGGFDRTTSDETAATAASTSGSLSPPPPLSSVHRQTWIVTELGCGTLDRAIRTGVFAREAKTAAALAPAAARETRARPTSSPTAAILATLHEVSSGLAYLHKVQIIHGDVKPSNILLRPTVRDRAGRKFTAMVSDFGLSRVLSPTPGAATHTFTHTFGTAAYVSPEMMREGRLSRAADCHSLAMVMFELWSGAPPFDGLPAAAVFWAVGVERRRPSLDGFETAPPGFVDLMTALWADDPASRPTAAEAGGRLAAMLETELGQR